MAAISVSPAPTGTGVTSLSFTPALSNRYSVRKSVDEPRPVTPMRLPLKIGDRPDFRMCGRDHLDLARNAAELDDRFGVLAERLQVDGVVVEADHALHRAGQHLVGRLDARRLAEQRDVETLVGEIAQFPGEHRRQIDLLLDAADHDRDVLGTGGGNRHHAKDDCNGRRREAQCHG